MKNKLPVVEEFYTLQGEGYYMGTAAYFVRLAGCDVGCCWCDSKPSWKVSEEQWIPISEIIERIVANPSKVVVITGGEPFSYDLSEFTSILKEKNISTHVETSGTEKLTGMWDWITFSPKEWNTPLNEYFECAHELKVIIQKENDLHWAEQCRTKMNKQAKLFLQPEWSSFPKILPIIIDYIKWHPYWRISVQSHKFMKIP